MASENTNREKTVKVDYLTRVEGEGGVYVRSEGGELREVKINIFEPPRFFEAFLRGRYFQEVPDITARICGICPVAYQMSAVHALEAALEVIPPPEIRALRRLLYCGEWIESHALHIYMLNAPDFLGYESVVAMAADHPQEVEQALRLKKIGNRLLAILGGRSVHPVSVCVGGFYKAPHRKELESLAADLRWGIEASKETLAFVTSLSFPNYTPDYEFVSVSHPNEYPMNERRIVSSKGVDIEPEEFERVYLEEHIEYSTALHSSRADSGASYFVGPLARINLNLDKLMPQALEAARTCGVSWPCRNPYMGIVARAIELIHACEEALAIIGPTVSPLPAASSSRSMPGKDARQQRPPAACSIIAIASMTGGWWSLPESFRPPHRTTIAWKMTSRPFYPECSTNPKLRLPKSAKS